MNKHFKNAGIIIRKIDLNDADRIVTVLTCDHGKIDCIAKGARRLKSKFCGRLELFSHINLTYFQGRDLAMLNEVDLIQGFLDTKDINKHKVLFFIAEMTNKLIQQGQRAEGIYELLTDTLKYIEQSYKSDVILHGYLIKLLTLTGFLSPWDKCAKCNDKLNIDHPVYLTFEDLNAVCAECKNGSDRIIDKPLLKWINFLQNYPISETLKISVSKEYNQAVWQWIQKIVGNLFNTAIKSEKFMMMV